MTTIAFDGKTLAADQLFTTNDTRDSYAIKIFRSKRGNCLITAAGNAGLAYKFRDWIEGGMNGPSPYEGSDTGNGILITRELGSLCWSMNGCFRLSKKHWAFGSGTAFANAIMAAGGSAEEAVRIAIKLDIYSGGEVDVLTL